MHFIRFPKDRNIASQWNIALGFDGDKIINGKVCIEHFEEENINRGKLAQLKKDAVPKIFKQSTKINKNDNELGVSVLSSSECSTSVSRSPLAETIATAQSFDRDKTNVSNEKKNKLVESVATNQNIDNSSCNNCKIKDQLILLKDSDIKNLKIDLKKTQNRIYYLENTQSKLQTALSELKEKQLLDAELCKKLEV